MADVPSRLLHYELRRKIGEGGMGAVYEAALLRGRMGRRHRDATEPALA